MADKQDSTPAGESPPEVVQAAAELQKVEIKVDPEKKQPAPATAVKTEGPKQDDLSQLSPAIMEALCFNSNQATEQDLRSHNTHLQTLLGKVIELLKEKSALCGNLEKQIAALSLQSNSLKDVVSITKDLLSIRNMEVEHLHVDMKSMEEKINGERERHNNMLNRMSEAVKLNENLKTEYQTQLGLFTDLRARYEQKVTLLENENKRLAALKGVVNGDHAAEPAGEGEGGIQLSLQPLSPP